jgi:hypothetical protein
VVDEVPIAVEAAPEVDSDSSEFVWVPPPSQNYFARHWRGEISLGRSYWLNGVLAGFALRAFLTSVAHTYAGTGGPYGDVARMVATRILILSVNTWQFVGIWRSASRSKARGWALAAKICICAGVVTTLVQYGRGLPALRGAIAQARWLAENGSATFRADAGGTELEVYGGTRLREKAEGGAGPTSRSASGASEPL